MILLEETRIDEPLPQLQKIKSNDISDELTQETKIDNSITTVSVKDLTLDVIL